MRLGCSRSLLADSNLSVLVGFIDVFCRWVLNPSPRSGLTRCPTNTPSWGDCSSGTTLRRTWSSWQTKISGEDSSSMPRFERDLQMKSWMMNESKESHSGNENVFLNSSPLYNFSTLVHWKYRGLSAGWRLWPPWEEFEWVYVLVVVLSSSFI